MIKEDKITILRFIVRPGMYINIQDRSNIISFISGFELGSSSCDFTNPFKIFITEKFSLEPSSTGFPGQIDRLASKFSLSWNVVFKILVLEFILLNDPVNLREELHRTLKTRIESIIARIKEKGGPWFNEEWTQEWQSYCSSPNYWFKQIWTEEEWMLIKAIDYEVQNGNVFVNKEKTFPSHALLELKSKYDKL